MIPQHSIWRIILVLCATAVLVAVTLIYGFRAVPQKAIAAGGSVTLHAPAFAGSMQTDNPEGVDFSIVLAEAGMTAYTKLDQELDLVAASSRFKTIAKQTDLFIAGIVIPPGYEERAELEESAEVQLFLHRDGWIVAYLTRWQPASYLFDWVNYEDNRLKHTLLESTVNIFAEDEGVVDHAVSHYDFRYPEATNLILAADRADGTTQRDSFQINIPRGIAIHEASWSLSKFESGKFPAECKFNNELLGQVNPAQGNWMFATGTLDSKSLSVNTTNKIDLVMDWWYADPKNRIYCGLSIVYGQ